MFENPDFIGPFEESGQEQERVGPQAFRMFSRFNRVFGSEGGGLNHQPRLSLNVLGGDFGHSFTLGDVHVGELACPAANGDAMNSGLQKTVDVLEIADLVKLFGIFVKHGASRDTNAFNHNFPFIRASVEARVVIMPSGRMLTDFHGL
jgi:hypothetical protein